jgi:hypothetical protein
VTLVANDTFVGIPTAPKAVEKRGGHTTPAIPTSHDSLKAKLRDPAEGHDGQVLAAAARLDREIHRSTPGPPRTRACGCAQGERRGQRDLGSKRGFLQAGILRK